MNVKGILTSQPVRYIINGLAATAINFATLSVFIFVLGEGMAWLASGLASCIGITASFVGSRYFVFPGSQGAVAAQAGKFVAVYAATACLHAAVLFLWTDTLGWDWRIGFLIATGLQVAVSYSANKFFVFK